MPPTGQQHYGPQFENQSSHQVQQPYFQYSQCTGKKKALCVSAWFLISVRCETKGNSFKMMKGEGTATPR